MDSELISTTNKDREPADGKGSEDQTTRSAQATRAAIEAATVEARGQMRLLANFFAEKRTTPRIFFAIFLVGSFSAVWKPHFTSKYM